MLKRPLPGLLCAAPGLAGGLGAVGLSPPDKRDPARRILPSRLLLFPRGELGKALKFLPTAPLCLRVASLLQQRVQNRC